MRKLIVCNNLIGDSLYLLKPLDIYLETFPGDCIGLAVLPQLGGDIVRAHFKDKLPVFGSPEEATANNVGEFEVMHLDAGRAMQIAFEHHRKYKQPIHISEAFAFMLGIDIKGDTKPPLEWLPILEEKTKENIAIIAPFSASCTRHEGNGRPANKTIDDWKWEHIIRYLRRHDYNVQCLCGPKDLFSPEVKFPITSYRTGKSLNKLLGFIQNASLVVSVDNGIGHLASACNISTIILWPEKTVPAEFIAPMWAKKTSYVMMGNPNKVEPAGLLYGIKAMLLNIIGDKV